LFAFLIAPVRAIFIAHLILLYLIIQTVYGEAKSYEAPHNAVFASLPPIPPS
jgi:hypothetical protein